MRAIVTGAASGIGRATARMLAVQAVERAEAPQIVIADIARTQLELVADELRSIGAEVVPSVGDLSDPSFPAEIVAQAAGSFGGLDVLISNAGVIQTVTMLEMTIEQFDLCFAINTRPTWLLAKAAHPMLKASRGCIVATSSIAGYEPSPMLGAYAPSKAALMMLVRQMASAWGADGIRSNSVSPGSTATSIGQQPGSGPRDPNRVGRNPLGLVAGPDDQAAVIAFLASPAARFINGADIVVDGGARTQLMAMSGMANPAAR